MIRVAATLLDVLVPQRCLACGSHGIELCDACLCELWSMPRIAGAVVPDAGAAGRLVRAGKHARSWRVGRLMADVTRRRVEAGALLLPPVDVVTWVPHDPVRGRARGLNLPELYARALASNLGVPAIAALTRRRGAPQRGGDIELRRRNVGAAFRAVVDGPPSQCRLLLLDDVRTTGATLSAAARALPGCTVATLAFAGVPRRSAN